MVKARKRKLSLLAVTKRRTKHEAPIITEDTWRIEKDGNFNSAPVIQFIKNVEWYYSKWISEGHVYRKKTWKRNIYT